MVLPDHVCPFGVRAKAMLDAAGYDVDDQQLTTREEVEAFKEKESVSTTPVTFIGGQRFATSEKLEEFLSAA
jgi:glutaredoxin